ncbi:MAG: PEGA domain-containing protein, partial [Acidimicrobiia bacterium]|nr:PEGA domain-containing protein [Acidimicrobiia bacterium]
MSLSLMAAGAAVETLPSPDSLGKGEIQATAVVFHVDGPNPASQIAPLIDRLRDGAWIIVVLPKSNLAETVAVMELSDRVAGVLVADQLSSVSLSSMATRILYGDIFGLEKIIPWGNRVYSALVGDYQEKSVCISEISEFAGAMRVRRKYREAIEQCVDEMLMNALYDAPVDASGEMLFAKIPTKSRITMRLEQKAVVQYACDGKTFTVSVRDNYGTLARETVMQYLHKCIHSEDQIDRKTGGAGLGLYIMANATTQFVFNVLPGVATECICSFDLTAPKVQLKHFGFFEERIDATGRLMGEGQLVAGGRRSVGAVSKPLMFFLSSAVILLLGLVFLVAYDRFAGPGTSAVNVETEIADCEVQVEGSPRGRTNKDGNLEVDGLKIGEYAKITASCDGYEQAEAVVRPVKGTTIPLGLRPKAMSAKLRVTSNVPDVRVLYKDKLLGTTPTVIDSLPPGKEAKLKFERTGYDAKVESIKIPEPGKDMTHSVSLSMSSDYGSFKIISQPAGADIVKNGEPIVGKTTPVDEVLVEAGKKYSLVIRKKGYQTAKVESRVERGQRNKLIEVKLEVGGSVTIVSNISGRVTFTDPKANSACGGKLPIRECGLPNATYKARFEGAARATKDFRVKVNGDSVKREIRFGIFKAKRGYKIRLGSKGKFRADVAVRMDQTVEIQYIKDGSTAVRTIRVTAKSN